MTYIEARRGRIDNVVYCCVNMAGETDYIASTKGKAQKWIDAQDSNYKVSERRIDEEDDEDYR